MGTKLNVYLNFNGQCSEAMKFYHECIGGELSLQKISESPMAAQMPSEEGSRILHGSLIKDQIAIFGSDMIGANLVRGNGVTLYMDCKSDEEINLYFTRLSEGGHVKLPLHQSFWGATFGELTDRFGLNWMFTYSRN